MIKRSTEEYRIAIAVVALLAFLANTAAAQERTVHDVFVNGKLAPGVRLVNGNVQGKQIRTVPLGAKGWANPTFQIHGLDIDISKVEDLSQVHVRMVAQGKRDNKPGYADVHLLNSKGRILYITQFPFRSWQNKRPDYMMKSADHSPKYTQFSKGRDYGRITGIKINCRGGFAMRFSKVQILIDKSMADRYPDDPKPDPNWQGGRISAVYAIPVSERVYQKELDSPLGKGNEVFRQGRVRLSGARNETVAFQVIMQTVPGAAGVNDVNVKFTGVSKGDATIDNSNALDPGNPYAYVGRYIQLYRTRYVLYDKKGRRASRGWRRVLNKWIPEIQIPFEAKWGGAPFSIFPGKVQAVWVDIYIPKNAEAGLYTGRVEVQVADRTVKTLPVELTVHDFALPNEFKTVGLMYGTVPAKHGAKTEQEKWELEKIYRQFYRRHHGGLFRGFGVRQGDREVKDPRQWELRGGKIYTREEGYEGPGEGVPTQFIFIRMYGGKFNPFGGPTEAHWHRGLLPYKRQADMHAKDAMLIYYVWDEPGHDFKGGIPAYNKWFNESVAPHIKSFNKKYNADIKSYASVSPMDAKGTPDLDIYRARNREQALQMEREGDINAAWNGTQPLSEAASALRAVGWRAYYLRTSFWWMWHSTKYSAAFDVYRDAYNFRNQYGEVGAGTGMFVYPGTDIYVTKRNPGLKGPVPGTRFFNWRQGFIDAEYVALAAKKDKKAADAIVARMVSGARLNSGLPGEQASIGYPIGEKHYAKARAELVKIILGD